MTTTEANGHQSTHRNLLPGPGQALPPRPRQPEPDAAQRSPDVPSRPNLAAHDQRRQEERRANRQRADADYWMQTRVRHPDGGGRTVVETQADEAEQRRMIRRETDMQSRKHHRLPRWQRWIPKFVLFFDFALLLYFFGGVTNVNWYAALSPDLAFAAALAGMVTVLSYGFLAFTGHRMQLHKNHSGTVHLADLDGFTKAAFGTALAVIAVLGSLMFVRIRSEVFDALGPRAGMTALVIPLAVAVVSAVANYLVVLIHALDGSHEVARLEKLGAATRRPARKANRLHRQAARQTHQ